MNRLKIRFLGKCPDGQSLTYETHVIPDIVYHLVNILWDPDLDEHGWGVAQKTKSLEKFQALVKNRAKITTIIITAEDITPERTFYDN